MTTYDILRMEREVADKDKVDPVSGPPGDEFVTLTPEELERLFRLAYAAGAAAEREECAKVCKNEMMDEAQCNDDVAYNAGCYDCEAAIRARGKT